MSTGRITFLDFVHCLMFLINTMFRKLDLFLSSGKIMGAPTLLGPLETASLNHWTDPTEYVPPSYYLRTETDPLSKTLFFRNIRYGQSPKTWFFQVHYTIVKTL
jgi:hypothetical protein